MFEVEEALGMAEAAAGKVEAAVVKETVADHQLQQQTRKKRLWRITSTQLDSSRLVSILPIQTSSLTI